MCTIDFANKYMPRFIILISGGENGVGEFNHIKPCEETEVLQKKRRKNNKNNDNTRLQEYALIDI